MIIWIRAFGNEAAKEITSYIHYIHKELSSDFNLKILVATNKGDLVEEAIKDENCLSFVHIVYANMSSNHQELNSLIEATPFDSFLLSLSLGVKIKSCHIKTGFDYIRKGAWVYGWKINSMGNDGSAPGLGWYNTAALYSKSCLNWMKVNLFPDWIDDGIEGCLIIDDEEIPIGGNEEIVLMTSLLKQGKTSAYYVLNIDDSLELDRRTGNEVSFESKIKRKTHVANYYVENKFCIKSNAVWNRLKIVSHVNSNANEDNSLMNTRFHLEAFINA